MKPVTDPHLRRFWFPIPGHIGIGVTAYTRAEAEALAQSAADEIGWRFDGSAVVEDIEFEELDQGHVVPNMGPIVLHGVWYPAFNLRERVR